MKKLLTICLLLFLDQTAYAFKCLPSTCTVDVIESGTYTFGVEHDDVVITKCSYRTNNGITGSFEVIVKNTTKSHQVKKKNEISDFGKMGLCQMKVEDVDDTGPTYWTLTPSCNETNFPDVNFTVNFFYKSSLLLDTVSVQEMEGFYQYFKSSVKFLSCKVAFGQNEVDLNINEMRETTDPRISSLGKGLCGFVLKNVTLSDPQDWSLFSKDAKERSYKQNFKLGIFSRPNPEDTNINASVTLGDSVAITCGEEHNQQFCNLYNPLGEFVITNRNCAYNIRTVAVHDLGTWLCIIGKTLSMETLTYKFHLSAVESFKVVTWLTEDNEYVNIGCQMVKSDEITECRMIFPSGDAIIVRSGTVYGRYMSFGTDYNNATCSLMIKKPLTDADKGLWRCEIHLLSTRTGGFINVGSFTPSRYKTNKTIVVQLDQQLDIQCEVPYPSEYCYIKSPNGTEYEIQKHLEIRLGICTLTISSVKPEHVGFWHCYFSRQTGMSDEEVTVKVTVPEILLRTTKVEEHSGGNASLMCTSQGLPLQYCRFVAPNSLSYFIGNRQNSSRISYNGKGLEYGECGITITNVAPSDSGIWTCITKIGNSVFEQKQLSATINLEITPTFLENPATAVGFSVAGGVVIASIIAYFGFKQWKKRRPHLPTFNYNRDTSREDMFNYEQSSYENAGDNHKP